MTKPRAAWFAGLTVGVGAGALSMVIPFVGWTIGGAFLVGAVMSRSVAAGIGGLLLGAGAAWLALLVQADVRCRSFTGPGSECVPPDISPWLVVGAATLVSGTVVTLLALHRRRSRGRGPNTGGRT